MKLFFALINCILIGVAVANVEKVIFSAPQTTTLPTDASIDNLLLTSLHPKQSSVRTHLSARFPTTDDPRGIESWILLENLSPGQRYEVRVCWLATQPTEFWLDVFSLSQTFDTPSLISSLSSYAHNRHASLTQDDVQTLQTRRVLNEKASTQSSFLFLRIGAAADYFTLNQTLMHDVPPVLVDIILDPFLFGVFPQSLVSTAVYLSVIAAGAWFLSAWVVRQLHLIYSDSMVPIPEKTIESKKSK